MPFSHRPLDFAASSYTRLMADARRLVGPRPKTLIVAHYARNGLLNNAPFDPVCAQATLSAGFDSIFLLICRETSRSWIMPRSLCVCALCALQATLREELEIDLRGGSADGAAVWSMPLAIAGAPDRAGIFSEKKLLPPPPPPHHPSANITAPLLTYFPSGQTGYFGWFQRYVSRGVLPLDADAAMQPGGQLVKLAMKHSNQKPYAGSTPLFTKAVYLRSDASQRLPAAVLYFGAAEGRACSTAGDFPCPGSAPRPMTRLALCLAPPLSCALTSLPLAPLSCALTSLPLSESRIHCSVSTSYYRFRSYQWYRSVCSKFESKMS